MSGKPLDCVGIAPSGIGKHDFQLNGPIVHAAVTPQGPEITLTRRTPESQDRYYAEKIAELVMTQKELAHVVAERDALKSALDFIARSDGSNLAPAHRAIVKRARETLAKLASGELRKLTA